MIARSAELTVQSRCFPSTMRCHSDLASVALTESDKRYSSSVRIAKRGDEGAESGINRTKRDLRACTGQLYVLRSELRDSPYISHGGPTAENALNLARAAAVVRYG